MSATPKYNSNRIGRVIDELAGDLPQQLGLRTGEFAAQFYVEQNNPGKNRAAITNLVVLYRDGSAIRSKVKITYHPVPLSAEIARALSRPNEQQMDDPVLKTVLDEVTEAQRRNLSEGSSITSSAFVLESARGREWATVEVTQAKRSFHRWTDFSHEVLSEIRRFEGQDA